MCYHFIIWCRRLLWTDWCCCGYTCRGLAFRGRIRHEHMCGGECPRRAVLPMISPMIYLSDTTLCIVEKEHIFFLYGTALNASHMSFRCAFLIGLGYHNTWTTLELTSAFFLKQRNDVSPTDLAFDSCASV